MSPFGHHLDELRWRVGFICLILLILTGIGFLINDDWLALLTAPLCSVVRSEGSQTTLPLGQCGLLGTTVFSGLYLRVAGAGLFTAMFGVPLGIWQSILFCKPIVTSTHYRHVVRYGVGAVLMWWITLAVSWWLLGPILTVAGAVASPWVVIVISPPAYVAVLTSLVLGLFALSSLPGCAALLLDLGIITGKDILNYRKHGVVGVLAVSAVVTPTQDPITMVVLAIPIIISIELLGWRARHGV